MTNRIMSGHFPIGMREEFLDLLELDNRKEWWEGFDSPEQGLKFIDKFWNCTDVIPGDSREDAEQWLVYMGCSSEKATEIRQGCSYAKLVRVMKRISKERINCLRITSTLKSFEEVKS